MATTLDKDLIRESTITVEERNIIVTLTADQKIIFKLKGMKSGHVEISIEDLYKQLKGNTSTSSESDDIIPAKKKQNGNDQISLNDLKSHNMIACLDYQTKVKFDGIISDLIEFNR